VNGLEAEYGDRIIFQRLNIDEPDGRRAAKAYRLRGHPTVIIFDTEGKQVWSQLGAQPREIYVRAIESVLE